MDIYIPIRSTIHPPLKGNVKVFSAKSKNIVAAALWELNKHSDHSSLKRMSMFFLPRTESLSYFSRTLTALWQLHCRFCVLYTWSHDLMNKNAIREGGSTAEQTWNMSQVAKVPFPWNLRNSGLNFHKITVVTLYFSRNLQIEWQIVQNRWVTHPIFSIFLPKMSRFTRFFM